MSVRGGGRGVCIGRLTATWNGGFGRWPWRVSEGGDARAAALMRAKLEADKAHAPRRGDRSPARGAKCFHLFTTSIWILCGRPDWGGKRASETTLAARLDVVVLFGVMGVGGAWAAADAEGLELSIAGAGSAGGR